MPKRRQELVLVQHPSQNEAQLVGIDHREQPPLALSRRDHRRHVVRQVGAVFDEPVHAPLGSRQLIDAAVGSSVSTANSGISPTIERTFSGTCMPSGSMDDVVVEAVLFVPHALRRHRPGVDGVGRCRGSARRTCWRRPRRPGPRAPAPARWPSMFRQYIAIQPVPSACSR